MYCNYSNDKFNNECTFIIPNWISKDEITNRLPLREPVAHDDWGSCMCEYYYSLTDKGKEEIEQNALNTFLYALCASEKMYFGLLSIGWTPQQARSVLPNSLKTELCMTGTVEQWKGFFKLRCAQDAHPQARELAIPLEEEFKNRGLI